MWRVSQRRRYGNRQNHPNRRPFSDFALGFDVAAVELRDMFHNRQAKAGASNAVVAARFVGAIEALENAAANRLC